MEVFFGIILLITAVFLTVAVLMQSGKSHNLSGAIAGGAETFFGKTKGKAIDKMLAKITTVVSIIFAILVIIVYVIQPDTNVNYDEWFKNNVNSEAKTSDTSETTAATSASTKAADSDKAIFETSAATTTSKLG